MKKEEIKEAVKEAVEESLLKYGFSIDDPREMQKDMLHVRHLRMGCEATKRNILKAFITVTVPSACYIVWEAFKTGMHR